MQFVIYCLLWTLFSFNIEWLENGKFILAQDNLQIISDRLKPKTDDRCEIEILTHGSCLINDKRIEPKFVINFKGKPNTLTNLTDSMDENDYAEKDYQKGIIFEFILQTILLMKMEYGHLLRPLVIDTVQRFNLQSYGKAEIPGMTIYGIDEIKPLKTSIEFTGNLEAPVWDFNVTFYSPNITAEFAIDVNVNERVFIKQWTLTIIIERCLLNSGFIVQFETEKLLITSFQIKSFKDFKIISEPMTWPLSEIVSNIIRKEKFFIKNAIEIFSQKYINMTLSNYFDLNLTLKKIANTT